MVLGMEVEGNSAPTDQWIQLSVSEMVIIDVHTLYLIYSIFGGLFFIILAITIGICAYQTWKRRQNRKISKKANSTLHFQKFMPEKTFEEFSTLSEDMMCAVCLE